MQKLFLKILDVNLKFIYFYPLRFFVFCGIIYKYKKKIKEKDLLK